MKKISYGQLISILVLVRAFSLISFSGVYSTEKMIGVLISIIFQILVTLPMLTLYKKQSFNIKNDMLLGRFGFAIYGVFFILWGALSFLNLWGVTEVIYLPIGSKVFGAILVGLVGLYGAFLGIRTVGRSCVLGIIFTVLSLIIMILGAYSKVDISNIMVIEQPSSILKYAIDDFLSSGELPALFLLLGITENKRTKATSIFLTSKFILAEIIMFLGITVLGNLMKLSQYPFFATGAYSQPFAIQRTDGIYMILFTLLCVINITIQILLASLMLKEIFPKYKWKEVSVTIIILAVALLLDNFSINLQFVCGMLIILLAVIIPVIMLFTVKDEAVSKK